MSTPEDTTAPRPGSSVDLSRLMDRMEQNHEQLAREVSGLTGTVARVELNQKHAEELNKLRFDSLETGVGQANTKLDNFMARIEGLISGEVSTAQSRAGQELVEDYKKWRLTVENRLDGAESFQSQGRLVGRVIVLLLGTGWIGTVVTVIALLTRH